MSKNIIKPQCPKCLGEESPDSVENVSVGNGKDLWKCHECQSIFKPSMIVNEKLGRPSIGVTKKVSITLPAGEWEEIDEIISNGHASSRSEYFRLMHNGLNENLRPLPIITPKHNVFRGD
jgi:ribosomal protein L37AE/L43A